MLKNFYTLLIGASLVSMDAHSMITNKDEVQELSSNSKSTSGEIKKQNATEFENYQSLAVLGDSDATYNMGLCYMNGKGVNKDLLVSLRIMYNLAVTHEGAKKQLKTLLEPNNKFAANSKPVNIFDVIVSYGYMTKNSTPCTLDNFIFYHNTSAMENDENALFKAHKTPLHFLHLCHKPIADFAMSLQEFFAPFGRPESDSKQTIIPNGALLYNMLSYNSFIPCSLAEAYKNSKSQQVQPVRPKGLEWIDHRIFSTIVIGKIRFYNIGFEAILFVQRLKKVMEKLPSAKEGLASLMERKKLQIQQIEANLMTSRDQLEENGPSEEFKKIFEKASVQLKTYNSEFEELKNHKAFLDNVDHSVINIFYKTVSQRERDFLNGIGGSW